MYTYKELNLAENHKLIISYDDSAESPRDWCNMGIMACEHRRYDLGDTEVPRPDFNNYENWDEYKQALIDDFGAIVILPLYPYDHSGITMATSPFNCRWDSGQVGFIYTTEEKVKEAFGRIDDLILTQVEFNLQAEVELYDEYLRGNVFWFELTKDDEPVDSCSGFYGTNFKENGLLDYIPQEYREEVEALL